MGLLIQTVETKGLARTQPTFDMINRMVIRVDMVM